MYFHFSSIFQHEKQQPQAVGQHFQVQGNFVKCGSLTLRDRHLCHFQTYLVPACSSFEQEIGQKDIQNIDVSVLSCLVVIVLRSVKHKGKTQSKDTANIYYYHYNYIYFSQINEFNKILSTSQQLIIIITLQSQNYPSFVADVQKCFLGNWKTNSKKHVCLVKENSFTVRAGNFSFYFSVFSVFVVLLLFINLTKE